MFCEMYRIMPLNTIRDLYEKGYIKSKVSEKSATGKRRGFYSYQYRKAGVDLYGYYILIPEICKWQAQAEARLRAA